MAMRIVLYSLMFTLLAACTGYRPPRFDSALYPHCYQGYDLALSWRTGRDGSSVTIDGFVRNNRNAFLRGMELTLELLDDRGRKLSAATFFFIPDLIQLDELKPFDLKLPLPPDTVPKRLKFRYKYYLHGEGYQTPYFHSFEAEL